MMLPVWKVMLFVWLMTHFSPSINSSGEMLEFLYFFMRNQSMMLPVWKVMLFVWLMTALAACWSSISDILVSFSEYIAQCNAMTIQMNISNLTTDELSSYC